MQQIPEKLNTLFWDINVQIFNPADFPDYTISRILEFGDEQAFAWLKSFFSEERIKNVLKSNNKLSRKSSNFWAVVYGIPFNEVASLTDKASAL